jgi:glycyl-tRNA synthetase
VAAAIGEQYQPIPKTKPGLALALADRMDSLTGLFAAGLAPTGTKDPFGLRRAAIGIVQPIIEHTLDFDLRAAVSESALLQPVEVKPEVQSQVLDFIAGRLRVVLLELGYKYDVVDAVLAARSTTPSAAALAVRQLTAWVARPDWNTILPGYARCVRIIRSAQVAERNLQVVDKGRLEEDAEKILHAAIQETVHQKPSSVDEFLGMVVKLIPDINTFFDKVLVMAQEPALRRNRLALVGQIANLSGSIADLSKLEGF